MKVAVVDHGMGNLRSVAKALERAGASVQVSTGPGEVDAADALCMPGQGIFGRCMDNLSSTGMRERIQTWISDDRPYLGICLGMQVLFERSTEGEERAGLGILRGDVTRLGGSVRIPHIGWNEVAAPGSKGEYFYFDHSYAARPVDESIVGGWCEHGDAFAAVVATDGITAVQFHPEKSGASGIEYLKGWVKSV